MSGARFDITHFTVIPLWILKHKSLSITAKLCYAELRSFSNRDAEKGVWPSLATMAEDLGASEETISRAIAELVKIGAVCKVTRANKQGHRTSNLYQVRADEPDCTDANRENLISQVQTGAAPDCTDANGLIAQVQTNIDPDQNQIHLEELDPLSADAVAPAEEFALVPTASGRKQPKPKPEVHQAIDYYAERFEQLMQSKPNINGAKDSGILSRLINKHGLGEVLANIDQMLDTSDNFIRGNGYTIPMLETKWNVLTMERRDPARIAPISNAHQRIRSLMTSERSLTHSPIMGTANKQKKLGGGGKW
jgi:biotin operon repressor